MEKEKEDQYYKRSISFGPSFRIIENGQCVFSIDAGEKTLLLSAGDAEVIAALAIVCQRAGIEFTFDGNWIKVKLKAA